MSESAQNPKKISKPVIITSATALVLLLLLAIVLLIPNRNGDAGNLSAPSENSATTEQATQPATDSICGAGSSDNTDVLDAAPENEWSVLPSGWIVPRSETVGALQETNGLLACYEHSPAGSLFAAVNTFVQLNISSTMNSALENLVVDSSGKEIARNSRESLTNRTSTLRGYKFVNYSNEEATIQTLWATGGDSQLMAITLTMVWDGGDWKLRLPDNADMNVQQVSDTTQFIKWGA